MAPTNMYRLQIWLMEKQSPPPLRPRPLSLFPTRVLHVVFRSSPRRHRNPYRLPMLSSLVPRRSCLHSNPLFPFPSSNLGVVNFLLSLASPENCTCYSARPPRPAP